MTGDDLPSYKECCAAVDSFSATPLHTLIHDWEPVSDDADEWRDRLAQVLAAERERCAKIVEIFVKPAPESRIMDKIRNGVQP